MTPIGMAIGCALVWACPCGGGGSVWIADYASGRYVTCDHCAEIFYLARAAFPPPEADLRERTEPE